LIVKAFRAAKRFQKGVLHNVFDVVLAEQVSVIRHADVHQNPMVPKIEVFPRFSGCSKVAPLVRHAPDQVEISHVIARQDHREPSSSPNI
jgi:hypothetical protein